MLTDIQIKKLRDYLKKNKISQKAFGESLGITRTAIVQYFSKVRDPSKTVRKLISALTGINLED